MNPHLPRRQKVTPVDLPHQATTVPAPDAPAGPGPFQLAVLGAMQGMPVYGGTVPPHVVARRRARNKQARLSRRANRR